MDDGSDESGRDCDSFSLDVVEMEVIDELVLLRFAEAAADRLVDPVLGSHVLSVALSED